MDNFSKQTKLADLLNGIEDNPVLKKWYMRTLRDMYRRNEPILMDLSKHFLEAFPLNAGTRLTMINQMRNTCLNTLGQLYFVLHIVLPTVSLITNNLKDQPANVRRRWKASAQEIYAYAVEPIASHLSSHPELSQHDQLYLIGRLSDLKLPPNELRTFIKKSIANWVHSDRVRMEQLRWLDLCFSVHQIPPFLPTDFFLQQERALAFHQIAPAAFISPTAQIN